MTLLWPMPAPEYFLPKPFSALDDALPAVVDVLRTGVAMTSVVESNITTSQESWGDLYRILNERRTRRRTLGRNHASKKNEFIGWNDHNCMAAGWYKGEYGCAGLCKQPINYIFSMTGSLQSRRDSQAHSRCSRAGISAARSSWLRPAWAAGRRADRQSFCAAPTAQAHPPPAEAIPIGDACGLLWCSLVAPAEGQHAQILAELSARVLLSRGF